MSPKVSTKCAVQIQKSKPDLRYVKPLYYISLLTSLGVPINLKEYRAIPSVCYKVYCVLSLSGIAFMSLFSFYGRVQTVYGFMIQTVTIIDVFEQALVLITVSYSICNVLFFGTKHLSKYFATLKTVDEYLFTLLDLRTKKLKFYLSVIAVHLATIVISVYDYVAWANTLGFQVWSKYCFRLYSYYLCLVVVMQFCNFCSALKCRFYLLNSRLMMLCETWRGNSSEEQHMDAFMGCRRSPVEDGGRNIELKCLIRMHDTLCDIVEVVNDAFGFNILLLSCLIIVDSVMAFNLILIFGMGVVNTLNNLAPTHVIAINVIWAGFFVSLGIAVARSGATAGAEAWKTATICFKCLSYFPPESRVSKERETRQELLQFIQQVEHRRPSFDAAGFFPVNNTMLYVIVGAITSYIVIVIQFNNSPIMVGWNSTAT